MENRIPPRLTRDNYIHPSSSFHIYYQKLHERYKLHWHEFYELTFILEGQGTNVVNGIPLRLSKGSLILLTPADFHEISPDPGSQLELFNVIFSDEMLPDELRELLFHNVQDHQVVVKSDDHASIEGEFRRILDEFNVLRPGHRLVVKGTLMRILVDFVRRCPVMKNYESDPLKSSQHSAVHKVLIYLHHHFREPLSLAEVAGQAQLAPNYFSECFHKITGTSFQSYLQGLRLKFAKMLLSESDLSVTEICYASGFNTLTHFERQFKRKYGSSPKNYRSKSDRPY